MESDTDDDESFWTIRVFALAGLLLLLNTPSILSQPTLAGMAGGVVGGALAALAVVGVLKGVFVVLSRAASRLGVR